jgi:hypothetical protein
MHFNECEGCTGLGVCYVGWLSGAMFGMELCRVGTELGLMLGMVLGLELGLLLGFGLGRAFGFGVWCLRVGIMGKSFEGRH